MSRDNIYLVQVGINLRRKRDESGMSQQELADNCNVAKSTIQRIEKGSLNPSVTTVKTITEVLDIKISDLLG